MTLTERDLSRTTFHVVAVESLLRLPKQVQKQALKKVRDVVDVAPTSAGYPLKRELHGFRGIHAGRYRIIWRILSLESGEEIAEICYVGVRKEGDREDAYSEFVRLFEIPG
jgi:mRNA-degrading endonuclease RelE of RelBE toxin-antitoxin system